MQLIKRITLLVAMVLVVIVVLAYFEQADAGVRGRVVPPGTTVLILKPKGEPVLKHEGVYKHYGRDIAYFIDTKLKSYPYKVNILCADNINMSVSLKWIGSFLVTDKSIDIIKKKVPAVPSRRQDVPGGSFDLSLDEFFKTAMVDILSATARNVISPYITDNIREKRVEITKAIKEAFVAKMEALNYPVVTAEVLVTNLDYPQEITDQRKKIKEAELNDQLNAMQAKADVAKAKRDAELAFERGKAKIVEAKADAAANKIRAASLTPEILAVKQLEVLVELALGPNNTVVVIPFRAIQPGGIQDMMLNQQLIKEGMKR